MGRKYKLLSQSTANLTKEQQVAKLHAEILAADGLPEMQQTPPAYLDTEAKREYRRIVGAIGKLPLRNLDRAELENYATWYSVYKRTVQKMNEASGDDDKYYSFIPVLNKATANIKSLASDLGLNVNSRMQMNMPPVEESKPKSLKDVYGA